MLQLWESIIDKIHTDLECWGRIHPTLNGKKTIIQAIIGGCTQFLTRAQGMPPSIRDEIIKEIHTFLWEGDLQAQIAKEMLYDEIANGGINLLNLHSRNEVINIMWLKDFLNMSPTRHTWAYSSDVPAQLGLEAMALAWL
jgi:hypothetical protein